MRLQLGSIEAVVVEVMVDLVVVEVQVLVEAVVPLLDLDSKEQFAEMPLVASQTSPFHPSKGFYPLKIALLALIPMDS